MAFEAARLILAAGLAAWALQAGADDRPSPRNPEKLKTPQTPWQQLSSDERRILGPVGREWDQMPGYQQERLKGAARHYPQMQPIQKERFDQRIRDWATMSPQQRREARETFQGMRKLPPQQQHELRERWLQRQQERSGFQEERGGPPAR